MPELHRRHLLQGLAGAAAWTALGPSPLIAAAPRQADLIRAENEREGTTDWQLTYTRVDPKTKHASAALAPLHDDRGLRLARQRPRRREARLLRQHRPAPRRFVIDLYRLGYYQGKGGRHVPRLGPFEGKAQPTPPVGEERLRECRWEPCTTLEIPKDWVSGVYLGKLSAHEAPLPELRRSSSSATTGRPTSSSSAATTPGRRTTPGPTTTRSTPTTARTARSLVSGVQVSFDRPYGKYVQIFDNPLSQGSGEFLLWEFPLAFWMEQHGYDVTYCSNADVHADAEVPDCAAKAFLSVGHDEYWSRQQFDHVLAAVEAGVNVAFLSGNTCCFVTPFSPSSRRGAEPRSSRAPAATAASAPNERSLHGRPAGRGAERGDADRRPDGHAVQRLRRLDRARSRTTGCSTAPA